jgi:dephospho-CoA kinase
MFVIGLTGGIGTGKSEVCGILSRLGAVVINADLVGHEVYRPETEGWHRIVETFGKDVLGPTGAIDRRKLGAIVFSDAEALERLNAITHPRIYARIEERIAELMGEDAAVAVVEAALLIEANWTPLVDEVWVVVSDEQNVIDRLENRHLDHASIGARIGAQMTQSERVKGGDVVIDNDGTLAELTQSVEELWASRVARHKENTTQR